MDDSVTTDSSNPLIPEIDIYYKLLNVRIYVASGFSESPAVVGELVSLCGAMGVPVRIMEALAEPSHWSASGLRTVPAVELLLGDRPFRSWAGKIDIGVVRDALHDAGQDVGEGFPDQHVRQFRVIASTGCHRYGRWNEQALAAPGDVSGWSSPSRSQPHTEVLDFDLFCERPLTGIGLRPRNWNQCIDYSLSFPSRFKVSLSLECRNWREVLSVAEYRCVDIETQRWRWDACPARFVRLELYETAQRPESKYFCQLMEVEFWQASAEAKGLLPSFERFDAPPPTSGILPVKRGLLWSPAYSIESWRFQAGQCLPLRASAEAEIAWMVLEGVLLFRWRTGVREAERKAAAHEMVTIPAGLPFAIACPHDEPALALAVLGGHGNEIWRNPT